MNLSLVFILISIILSFLIQYLLRYRDPTLNIDLTNLNSQEIDILIEKEK